MDMLIKDCRLISPDRDEARAHIAIRDGVIEDVIEAGAPVPDAASSFDATGMSALPGFVDIHVHGCAGFDLMQGTSEALEGMARAKLSEGVTSFCPTTLTMPEADLEKALRAAEAYRKNFSIKQDRSFARIPGVHIEGPFISPEWVGAQNPAHIRLPDLDEILRLQKLTSIAMVSFAVEREGGERLAKELPSHGIVPACGHSAAKYSDFAKAKAAGLRHLIHFGNQMTPLHHRDIGLVGAGLLDDDVSVELICDKMHLSPEMVALVFKVKPIDRICLITDAISASGLEDGAYTLGGLDVTVRNGAAHLTGSPDVLAGSTLRMNDALKHAVEITGLPMKELVKTVSLNPSRVLGLEKQGKLEPGFMGDVVIMDDRFNIHAVFVHGVQKH